jgi:hypothetical protein
VGKGRCDKEGKVLRRISGTESENSTLETQPSLYFVSVPQLPLNCPYIY